MDFDGTDGAGDARFRVWHPDRSGRVVYITVAGALSRRKQRSRATQMARGDSKALDWRKPDDSG